MTKLIWAAAVALPLVAVGPLSFAVADLQIASAFVPDAERTGRARLKVLGFDVFDAELYAPSGKYDPEGPFALSIDYLRDFSGEALATRSIEEMRNQGYSNEAKLAAWQAEMERIFPDVNDETRITGVRDANGHAIFFKNGARIGTIADAEFSRRFFAIWLGERASDSQFRQQLTGAAN